MDKQFLRRLVVISLFVVIAAPVLAALLGRLPLTPNGTDYQAYYDTLLDKTWSLPTTVDEDYINPVTWASTITLGGFTDWYLAGTNDLRHMRNVNGVRSDEANIFVPNCYLPNLHWCLPETGRFHTPEVYVDTDGVTIFGVYPLRYSFQNDGNFYFGPGLQGAWAIRNGDIAVIPIPTAVILFSSALGLLGIRRWR